MARFLAPTSLTNANPCANWKAHSAMAYPWKPGAIVLIVSVNCPPGVMFPEVNGSGAFDPKKVSLHFPVLPEVPKGSAAVLEMANPVSKPLMLVTKGNSRLVPSGGSPGHVRFTPAPVGPVGPTAPGGPTAPIGPTVPVAPIIPSAPVGPCGPWTSRPSVAGSAGFSLWLHLSRTRTSPCGETQSTAAGARSTATRIREDAKTRAP